MNSTLFHDEIVQSTRIIYTPAPFAKNNLIYLQESGTLTALQPHTSKRTDLASYLFFIVMSGEGTLDYSGSKYYLKSGDCVFIDCRLPYAHSTSDTLWSLKWVHINGPLMSGIYAKYKERGGHVVFHPQKTTTYTNVLDTIYNMATSSDYIRDMKIYQHIVELLTLIMEESWHPENKKKSIKINNIEEIKDYLDNNFASKISLDFLAEKFYINKYYMTRIFKEKYGTTINNYILQIRIAYAKQLLRFSDKTIEHIGIECGLNDANYFSRVFKKVEGISPGEYRRSW